MFNPVDLPLRPSRRLAALLWIPSLAALSLVLTSSAPPGLQTLCGGAFLLQGAWSCWRHGLLASPRAARRLSFDTRRAPCCRIQLKDGSWREVTVADDSIVTVRFILLRLREEPGRRSQTLLLCPWNTNPDALRRLRVLLRLARTTPAGT